MVVARLALAAAALLAVGASGPASACQEEYCPPPPLLCEWGPFAGQCIYHY